VPQLKTVLEMAQGNGTRPDWKPFLLLLLLPLLVGAGTPVPAKQTLVESSSDWHLSSKRELLEQLSARKLEPHQTVQLLSRASDKAEPAVFLGKFSVSQLLGLLWTYEAELCTGRELESRRAICQQLATFDNLKTFCESQLDGMRRECSEHQADLIEACFRQIDRAGQDKLDELAETLELGDSDQRLDFSQFAEASLEATDSIRAACGQFGHAIEQHRPFLDDHHLAASPVVLLCQRLPTLVQSNK
jgi:AcrR family transcriptional regulator